MKRENLETVIAECLDTIAKVMGTSTSERVRYWPLRETKYPKVRHQLFPRDRAAVRLMKPEMFQAVLAALRGQRDLKGQPILNPSEIERLQRAWEHYQEDTLVAPSRVPERWKWLVAQHKMTADRMQTPNDVYDVLYPLLYEPMLRDDVETFNLNNKAFLSAFNAADRRLPTGSQKRLMVWQWYLVTAAFCHMRLQQEAARWACLAQLRSVIRETGCHTAWAEFMAHGHFENRTSTGALRAAQVVLERGVPEECSHWSGLAVARAASSAVFRGNRFHAPCDSLNRANPRDALVVCVEQFADSGLYVPEHVFALYSVVDDALNGNVDPVHEMVSRTTAKVAKEFGAVPHVQRTGLDFLAIAHVRAAERFGEHFHWRIAQQYLAQLDSLGRRIDDEWRARLRKMVDAKCAQQSHQAAA